MSLSVFFSEGVQFPFDPVRLLELFSHCQGLPWASQPDFITLEFVKKLVYPKSFKGSIFSYGSLMCTAICPRNKI